MEKVKLSSIQHYDKDIQGNPLISKQGKPYSRCFITDEKGRKLSGFGSKTSRNWKAGDEVNLDITVNGQYLNFALPPQTVSRFELLALETRVEALERKVFPLDEQIDEVFGSEPPVEDDQP